MYFESNQYTCRLKHLNVKFCLRIKRVEEIVVCSERGGSCLRYKLNLAINLSWVCNQASSNNKKFPFFGIIKLGITFGLHYPPCPQFLLLDFVLLLKKKSFSLFLFLV